MKINKFLLVMLAILGLAVSGCSTGRSQKADMDSLSNRLNSLESQLSGKDREIAALQSELASQRASAQNAENEAESLRRQLERNASEIDKLKAKKIKASNEEYLK